MLSAHLVHACFLESFATTSHNCGSGQQVGTCTWVACLAIGTYKHIATATLPLTLVFCHVCGQFATVLRTGWCAMIGCKAQLCHATKAKPCSFLAMWGNLAARCARAWWFGVLLGCYPEYMTIALIHVRVSLLVITGQCRGGGQRVWEWKPSSACSQCRPWHRSHC